jgi:hypothetical protein
MKNMLYLFLSLAFFFSTACSSSEGRLQPINIPSEQLTDTFYKNDTAILKSPNLRLMVLGEWSEKGGYMFELTAENLTDSPQTFDVGKIILTGDRVEKAEVYLRRNGVEDPYSGGDAEKELVVVKPSEKKKLSVQFKQEMRKEEYYAAGRRGDKLKIVIGSLESEPSIEFEAVLTSEMKPVL